MTMPRRTAPAYDQHPDIAELRYADGRTVAIPTRTVTETTKDQYGKPRTRKRHVYDLRGESRCERCGGQPEKDGSINGTSGIIGLWRIDEDGHWLSWVGACGGADGPPYTGCIYGAAVSARNWQWADAFDVPQGLTTQQWAVLRHAALPGDDYADAANRLRKGVAGPLEDDIADILAKVGAWSTGRPQ